ncbi:MAG: peptidylprolyl isomerase [Myxococcota bacterium]
MATSRGLIWARNLMVGAIILAFAFLFGQQGSGLAVPPVLEVDGHPITRDLFEFFRAQNEDLIRQTLGEVDQQTLDSILDNQTLGALIRRHLVAEQAMELGIWVAEPEVHAEIVSTPGFQRGGRFDRELFEQFVVRAGLENPRVYTGEVRKDLLMQKFQRAVASPVRVSRQTAKEAARREGTRIRVRQAVARPESFHEGPEPTEDEITAFAAENPDRIEALYQDQIEEFVRPEEVRARHILFSGPDANERAGEALLRIRSGASDFAQVASELSEDAATSKDGGDLGFFPRGRMLPAFEEMTFTLSPGVVSEPVETERGVHLILVEEHREGSERTLEETTAELARGLLAEERATDRAQKAAETLAARVAAEADFEGVAGELGLTLRTPPAFGWAQAGIPGLEAVPGLKAAALTLDSDHRTLPEVFEVPDGYAVVSLVEREEPTDEDLDGEVERTRERLAQELRTRVMTRWYESLRNQLQQENRILFFPLFPTG